MCQVFANKQSTIPLTEVQLKERAGDWFTMDRIQGQHCSCPGEAGEFVLMDKNHIAVIEGGKDYMECRICGGYSHL